jgi:hypothetical protein
MSETPNYQTWNGSLPVDMVHSNALSTYPDVHQIHNFGVSGRKEILPRSYTDYL